MTSEESRRRRIADLVVIGILVTLGVLAILDDDWTGAALALVALVLMWP